MNTSSWGVLYMQWTVGHKSKLCLIVIYIGYWSVVYSLSWDVESTSKVNSYGNNSLMGSSGSHSSSYTLMTLSMRVGLTLCSLLYIQTFW